MILSVLPPLKCMSTPCLLQIFFRLSPIPSIYETTMWHFVWYVLLGVFFFFLCWCLLKIFFMAHLGYLHAPSTSSRCCSSCSANSGVEQMVWALCVSVLMTLYLAAMLWLLSHGRYRSVWGGFSVHPYCETSIFFWSDDSVQKRYGAILFCLLYSKLDWRIYCVDVLEELLLIFLLLYYQGIINIPFPNSRGCSAVVIALCSKASMKMLAMIGLMADPMAAPLVCS